MSKFLQFEIDRIHQPAARDELDRRTWSSFHVRVGGRSATRLFDHALQTERTMLYLPVFPIAEWIVRNWWSILHELCPGETIPIASTAFEWTKRHCLRTADSSALLPLIYIFQNGRHIQVEWQADDQNCVTSMPGRFVDSGHDELRPDAVEAALAAFVYHVQELVRDVRDERVDNLTEQWRAIQEADEEERHLCVIAGRMGLDPYDSSELTDELATFISENLTSNDDPLIRDLTEVAGKESLIPHWLWLRSALEKYHLGGLSGPEGPWQFNGTSAAKFGYRVAQQARKLVDLSSQEPILSIESFAKSVLGKDLQMDPRVEVPGKGIKAVVGETSEGKVHSIQVPVARAESMRFLNARCLFHALVSKKSGPRLVTDANSWDQSASRAFAAELLAPQQGIIRQLSTFPVDLETIEKLSAEYRASTFVIQHQLRNAGIPVIAE